MASTNLVVLTGYLGQDPEMRTFPDGTPSARFRMATTDRWKDKETGELKSHTEWHSVVTQRSTAEYVAKYLKKGDAVQVIGALRTNKWTDKNDVERYTTVVRSNNVQGLDRKPDSGTASTTTAATTQAQEAPPMPDELDDDIPF